MAAVEMVRTVNVTKRYGVGDAAVIAVNEVNCSVMSGEFVAIVGPSGSGKSTLFNLIGGLDRPTSGNVFVDGVDVSQLTPAELATVRCHTIGYIFQTFNLISIRTALENVTLPMLIAGVPLDEAEDRAVSKLESVGLGHRLHHRPSELSGGQQQRVAIARALANEPAVLLADEPTGNLDQATGEEIITLIRAICDSQGTTIISATHDPKMIQISDRRLEMRDGKQVIEPRG